jgi:DnaJ-class molecular chaperone
VKIKITKGKNYDQAKADTRCKACSGSGYYDSYDFRRDRPIKCGACDGSGKEPEPKS